MKLNMLLGDVFTILLVGKHDISFDKDFRKTIAFLNSLSNEILNKTNEVLDKAKLIYPCSILKRSQNLGKCTTEL